MIIENGVVQIIRTSGGGIVNGRPIPVQTTLSKPIPCNLKTLHEDKRGKVIDSVFVKASYEVLIDTLYIPSFTAEKVIITDNRGNVKGEFRVQDIQHLDCVNAVKITV